MSSATRNTDAVANSLAGGEGFQPSVPRDAPITTHGHQPGQITSEAQEVPVFHAETLPAGTAPPEHTFKPNNIADVPATGGTKASDTTGGTSSADVQKGKSHPDQK